MGLEQLVVHKHEKTFKAVHGLPSLQCMYLIFIHICNSEGLLSIMTLIFVHVSFYIGFFSGSVCC